VHNCYANEYILKAQKLISGVHVTKMTPEQKENQKAHTILNAGATNNREKPFFFLTQWSNKK